MNKMVLVDTNILIDVLKGDSSFTTWSRSQLADVTNQKRATVNQLILAELAAMLDSPEKLDELVPPELIRRESIPFGAAFAAGQAFLAYRRRGGERSAPLPDFYIGAHAQYAGMKLLTRDVNRFKTYFPDIELICPDTSA